MVAKYNIHGSYGIDVDLNPQIKLADSDPNIWKWNFILEWHKKLQKY